MSRNIGSTVIHKASASLSEMGSFVRGSSKIKVWSVSCMSLESKHRERAPAFSVRFFAGQTISWHANHILRCPSKQHEMMILFEYRPLVADDRISFVQLLATKDSHPTLPALLLRRLAIILALIAILYLIAFEDRTRLPPRSVQRVLRRQGIPNNSKGY